MAILDTDLKYKLSITGGSVGNVSAQANPNASLGKYISTTVLDQTTTLNNLFDNISGDENSASTVDYRCVFVHNAHATLTLQGAVVWLKSEVSGGASIAIGVDPTAASAIGSSSAQALTIASETTAPSGVSFSSPTTKSGGISLGDIPAGSCRAVWLKRSAANNGAKDADGVTLRVEGDSAE